MVDEYGREYQRPVYRTQRNGAPWLFMLLMLPLFFLFGWVTNEAFDRNDGNGLEIGVGGAPESDRDRQVVSPTPDSMTEDSPIPTKVITPTPTEVPEEETDTDTGAGILNPDVE